MRRYIYAGIVMATALIAIVPATSASAASAHVLTTGKVGGPAVKPHAVLKAGLAKGSAAVFVTSLGKLTCAKSTVTAKVISNPAAHGTARESLTAQTFGKCTINVSGATVGKMTISDLPYAITMSDAKGDPVKVSGHSKSAPMLVTLTVTDVITVSCSYKATAISGREVNKGNETVFVKQSFKLSSGSSFCPKSATFSAVYAPLRDTSVKGSPAVFVS